MERVLEIEKFRNIGLKTKERIVLNNSLQKGKMGNLVIIVGTNNSGKSNVLDALEQFGKKELSKRDITTLSFANSDRNPSVALVTKDEDDVYFVKYTYDRHYQYGYPKQKKSGYNAASLKMLIQYFKEMRSRYDCGPESSQIAQWDESLSKGTKAQLEALGQEIDQQIQDLYNSCQRSYNRNAWNFFYECAKPISPKVTELSPNRSRDEEEKMITEYKNMYGVNFLPKIIRYTEEQISNDELSTNYNYLSSNKFFNAVLASISVKQEEIDNAYEMYRQQNNKGVLKDIEKKLNKRLKAVSKRFNKLYMLEEDSYEFQISFESSQIDFMLFRDGTSIFLNYQSTGFKWFFNLYFNLLCSKNLQSGDIIIMDEPATNLHVEGQCELRTFLKEFAIKNDITIILATHSPFLIDIDYLDELRVVSAKGGGVVGIDNDFSAINADDHDSLYAVKKALTVSNHVLYDPDKTVVFVEGITDYNYMVAFKKLFKMDDFVFLPISGIGDIKSTDFKEKQKKLSLKLMQIRKRNPILMVDSDGAGKAIKELNKKDSELKVFILSDADASFKDIESLFSADDLKQLGIVDKSGKTIKHAPLSALIKTHINEASLSVATKENFKKLFNYIKELTS